MPRARLSQFRQALRLAEHSLSLYTPLLENISRYKILSCKSCSHAIGVSALTQLRSMGRIVGCDSSNVSTARSFISTVRFVARCGRLARCLYDDGNAARAQIEPPSITKLMGIFDTGEHLFVGRRPAVWVDVCGNRDGSQIIQTFDIRSHHNPFHLLRRA